jgi:hypothetical protein
MVDMKLMLKINGVRIWPEFISQGKVHWRTLVKIEELPHSINGEVILNKPKDCQLLKKDSAPGSLLFLM